MKLCRLIYKSICSWDSFTNESLRELAATCETNNLNDDISGLLILSGDCFLQVLEGSQKQVNALYRKILGDNRHHDAMLISYEPIAKRNFEDWGMRFLDLSDLPIPLRKVFLQKYDTVDGFPKIPNEPDRALSLLFDAQFFCRSEFESEDENAE